MKNETDFTASGRTKRLYLDAALAAGVSIELDRAQAHYVRNVVRLRGGDIVRVFNGRDGEWRGRLGLERRGASVVVEHQTRAQEKPCDLDFLFAPLKHARLDYVVQKATEMGAARIRPVITAHTNAARVNTDRMRANAIEAAEQCGLVSVPEITEPAPLGQVLDDWPGPRALVFADEAGDPVSPVNALKALKGRPLALIVGPEGGFSTDERARLTGLGCCVPVWLGPRIMRADTAAVAALALIQGLAGDWSVEPK